MKFHLDMKPETPDYQLGHTGKIMLIGSCFSENIGALMTLSRFNVTVNPYGILFNPFSIAYCLRQLSGKAKVDANFFTPRYSGFTSFHTHSSVHATSEEALQNKINQINVDGFETIRSLDALIVTLGSAYYYRHKELNAVVANCHKLPSNVFLKELSDLNAVESALSENFEQLKRINPELKIIITVSPVKHLRDGIAGNTLSKATLLLAAHQLCAKHDYCHYFPAYELVNDDLRDYRFYKKDMAHPSEEAIEYVWKKFSDCFFDEKTRQVNGWIKQLADAVNHIPLADTNVEEVKKLEAHKEALEQKINSILNAN